MGRRKGNPVHGWLNVDKPADMTSTEVVGALRRLLNAKKAGHAGTLDPLATGILPIAFGEATKTVPYVQESPKVYSFTVAWGEARDTDDREGQVTESSDHIPDSDAIDAVLPGFVGEIEQTPPRYSAVKVDGERAYDLARAGEDLHLASRPATVYSLEQESAVGSGDAAQTAFIVRCGRGFYVRALARDLGLRLGTFGHVAQLRRTAVGPFTEATAVPFGDLMAAGHDAVLTTHLLPVETALDDIPALALTDEEACRLRNGQPVALLRRQDRARLEAFRTERAAVADALADSGLADTALVTASGRPVALVRVDGVALKPVRVLNL